MRASELTLQLDPSSSKPFVQQIVDGVVAAIREGQLLPGDALPGSRTLAEQCGVSRGTVVAAFEELQAQGWIDATTGRGSLVADPLPGPAVAPPPPQLQAFDLPTRPDLASDHSVKVFKLSHGVPDARLMSAEILGRAYSRAVRRRPEEVLDLGDPLGEGELRRAFTDFLRERQGLVRSPEQVMATRGTHHALSLVAQGLVKPGDRVAVENPGNPRAREMFQQEGAQVVPIPVDGQGLDVDALEAALRVERIRLVYVTPRYQVPTTVTLSAERRQRLLALAQEHRFAILEDDSEAEHVFDHRGLPPLATGEGTGSVIYLFSFSRLLAPGVRLGLAAGPSDAIERLSRIRQRTDTLGDMVLERAFASLLKEGEVHRHIHRVRKVYAERRQHLLNRLDQYFGPLLSCAVPPGGLSLWLRTRADLHLESWYLACSQHGVQFQLGRAFMADRSAVPAFPFAFGAFEPDEMDQILLRMRQSLPIHLRRT